MVINIRNTIVAALCLGSTFAYAESDPANIRSSIDNKHAMIHKMPLQIEYDMDFRNFESELTTSTDHQKLILGDGKYYHETNTISGNYIRKYSFDGLTRRTLVSYVDKSGKLVEVGSIAEGKGMVPVKLPLSQVYFVPPEIQNPAIRMNISEDKTTLSLEWDYEGERCILYVDAAHGNMPLGSEVYANGILRAKDVYSNPIPVKSETFLPGTFESTRFDKAGKLTKTVRYYNIKYTEANHSIVETALNFDIPEKALNNEVMKKRVPLAR